MATKYGAGEIIYRIRKAKGDERERMQWKFEEYIKTWFGKEYLEPEDKDMARDWQALKEGK